MHASDASFADSEILAEDSGKPNSRSFEYRLSQLKKEPLGAPASAPVTKAPRKRRANVAESSNDDETSINKSHHAENGRATKKIKKSAVKTEHDDEVVEDAPEIKTEDAEDSET